MELHPDPSVPDNDTANYYASGNNTARHVALYDSTRDGIARHNPAFVIAIVAPRHDPTYYSPGGHASSYNPTSGRRPAHKAHTPSHSTGWDNTAYQADTSPARSLRSTDQHGNGVGVHRDARFNRVDYRWPDTGTGLGTTWRSGLVFGAPPQEPDWQWDF